MKEACGTQHELSYQPIPLPRLHHPLVRFQGVVSLPRRRSEKVYPPSGSAVIPQFSRQQFLFEHVRLAARVPR